MMRRFPRRAQAWLALVVLFAAVVFLRRWIHHAELASLSIIVPDDVQPSAVVHPPPAAVLQRMAVDVRDAVSPPLRPRLAVLTFDDGPYPVTTPVLIARLKALGVPAVFFLIGRDVRQQPAIAQRAAADGLEFCDHTLTHPEIVGMPVAQQHREIAAGKAAIADVTRVATTCFRPPHGNFDAATITAARSEGQTVVLWDVDPGDWRRISAQQIVSNVKAQARAPAIILLHNGRTATIQALAGIVRAYRAAGFSFVSLAQLRERVPLDVINDPEKTPL
ncbi:MAG: hypothetical protein DLM53_10415 [Candidatus Eremiobacter antarcticus]|nr:polysaccharide deacetylase family protein [Candidatus Eremiobacteraeota bacterium]MBC5807794.1 polysaccharide deacetylase family protein [Candidatus Eremiobacteraeota bacterium]PZR60770.1 MAG: hypothetical protein DLM53_10415 [Candidatus Eremiobacter sp. RRmetagenome_bin22]